MEEIKKDTAQKSQTEELKEKYGKVYRVGATIEVDDETEKNVEFFFKRPSTASYDRYVTDDEQLVEIFVRRRLLWRELRQNPAANGLVFWLS